MITQVGSTAVNSTDQMLVAVADHRPGDTVEISYHRGGTAQRAAVPVTAP